MGVQWKHTVNVSRFLGDDIEPEAAYWAGFLLADGSVREKCACTSVHLAIRDRGHLERFRDFVNPTGEVRVRMGGASVRLLVYGAPLVAALKRFGIVPRKTYGHPLPDVPIAVIPHFIRGYLDGDGFIGTYKQKGSGKSYDHLGFCGNLSLLEWLRGHLVPIAGRAGSVQRSNGIYQLKFVGSPTSRIISFLNGTPRLERKWLQYAEAAV